MGLELATDTRVFGELQAIAFGLNQLLELTAALHEFGQRALFCGRRALSGRLQTGTESGQDLSIEPVGLGETALSTSEVTDVARIETGDGDAVSVETAQDRAFVACGGFAENLDRTEGTQPGHELGMTLRGIGELTDLGLCLGRNKQVESGLGDIHSDVDEG